MSSGMAPRFRLAAWLLLPLLAAPPAATRDRVRDLYSRDGKVRGVCFVAGPPLGEKAFLPLVKNNVEWISQTPFGYLSSAESPRIRMATRGHIYWGETDEGLEETARLARRFGIRTLLKPHLWVGGWRDAGWSGEIRMKSPEDWRTWFESYRTFILHYAGLAEASGMEALAVGTELQGTTVGQEKQWRALIRDVRKVYSGRITYAANWNREFEELPFWDVLDFVGVQAYFPLTDKSETTMAELLAGWAPHLKTLEQVAGRTHRPVIFTEVGYRSSDKASVQPWLWRSGDDVNLPEQARCYEAMFRAVWSEPWFRGAFVWKWFPQFDTRRSSSDNNFTPQGKPAEEVLGRWYSAGTVPALPGALPRNPENSH
jgi:Glycoside Hydrolase Family 113